MNDSLTTAPARWKDTQGHEYDVILDAAHIRLEREGTTIDLPRDRWPLDLYVARYSSGYLVRVETFAQSLQFIISEDQSAPLLSLIAPPTQEAVEPGQPGIGTERTAAPAERDVLWPKISPLALWALICSSLTFIPVVGWLPALITLILLILHRVYVRRTLAMSHSRKMCAAAMVFLVIGSAVSVLATWSYRAHGSPLQDTSLLATVPASPEHNWGMIISGILVILLSLSVHECAHAITAWWLGDGLAKSLGRVTLNPLAHIDPVGTVLLPIILAVSKAPIFFGYAKPVPVYVETLPRFRRAHILISVAGPGSNLLLAAASMAVLLGAVCTLRIFMPEAQIKYLASFSLATPVVAEGFPLASYFGLACTLLKLSFVVNIALAFFNLIPIPPLDGSWVLEHLFPRTLGPFYAAIRPYGFLIFVIALYSDVLKYVRAPVDYILLSGYALLAATTGW